MFQYKSLQNQDTVSVTFEQPSGSKGRSGRSRGFLCEKRPLLCVIVIAVVLAAVLVLAIALGVGLKDHPSPPKNPALARHPEEKVKIPVYDIRTSCGYIRGIKAGNVYTFRVSF